MEGNENYNIVKAIIDASIPDEIRADARQGKIVCHPSVWSVDVNNAARLRFDVHRLFDCYTTPILADFQFFCMIGIYFLYNEAFVFFILFFFFFSHLSENERISIPFEFHPIFLYLYINMYIRKKKS